MRKRQDLAVSTLSEVSTVPKARNSAHRPLTSRHWNWPAAAELHHTSTWHREQITGALKEVEAYWLPHSSFMRRAVEARPDSMQAHATEE